MALQTLNPPLRWRPEPSFPINDRTIVDLIPRRWALPQTTISVGACASCQIATGNDGFWDPLVGSETALRKVVPKRVDLATLGNLCVDIVLGVPSLPLAPKNERRAYMERLAASPPDKKFWEAGGNCNLAIAASRLGLSCFTVGHVGDEIYGNFLLEVLEDENINFLGMSKNADQTANVADYQTLLCWVLVDPFQKHGFCSRADFSEEPAFIWMTELTDEIKMAIQQSKILFCNGYAFDEFFPDLLISALDCAISGGTSVFFDPGPRVKTLSNGTPQEQMALQQFLRQSDVLLFTSDEVETLTGIHNPIEAGKALIREGVRTKWVIIKMGAKGSILIDHSSVSCAPSFKINVVDTVGCGDSYSAAIAFGFIHGIPAINTLTLANAVGAATATGCGAGRNVAQLSRVLELLNQSILDEDDKFWNELIGGNSLNNEVLLLSKVSINGHSHCFNRIHISSVVSKLLTIFEAANERGTVSS
ncbi:5-dehydro-2-deoxygluconokinase 2-like [Zingiber officinale]|uniref:Carbohydrate kinase PfkB domain-containing protein n=1 Tax=Zingiber officinale TaxID=94328 RepID=A0A8J5FCQ4_ZINOF|nr:5-dehydro-2-deoxygluconokinase 2-like [Zingiber officinale]KAG6484602.1 hypothetical protein ZIOFF_053123 [Zingiber officinale]